MRAALAHTKPASVRCLYGAVALRWRLCLARCAQAEVCSVLFCSIMITQGSLGAVELFLLPPCSMLQGLQCKLWLASVHPCIPNGLLCPLR